MVNSYLLECFFSKNNYDDPQIVVKLVDQVLAEAASAGASDVHFHPTSDGLQIKWRIDGVMHPVGTVPSKIAGNVIVRLKVLARLLTYQTDLPQEGRISDRHSTNDIRVSSFPTLFGEKVVARILMRGDSQHQRVHKLGLPQGVANSLLAALGKASGMILIVGPAGSGKTTTAYACLREILAQSDGRNIVSMEDPVEVVVEDVAQSEVSESVGFDLTRGLRSLMRQDPNVIFVGEIRDPATASIAYQAALTGQLVISTFHGEDVAIAISRLLDMDIPPYIVRSGTNLIVAQRLLRKLCKCAELSTKSLDEDPTAVIQPKGCLQCQQTGYLGRQVAAEALSVADSSVTTAIRSGVDAQKLRHLAQAEGMQSLHQQATELVAAGITSTAELIRVFGLVENC